MYENIYDIIPQYNMIQTKFRGENMTNSEEIYEFNKIDAYNKLKEAINYITGCVITIFLIPISLA